MRNRKLAPSGLLYGLACLISLAGLASLTTACGGNQYGYAREYVPLGDEEPFIERAGAGVSYEDVRRDPVDYQSTTLAWFGVVTSVERDSDNRTLVHATHRIHQARHLCSDETSGSCRVTVSDRQSGPFTAVVQIHPEDREGEARLWAGSLVKIYGSPTGEFDTEGGPIVEAAFYRHWPRGTYVTTGAAGSMRR
jgi:hypothetical protein